MSDDLEVAFCMVRGYWFGFTCLIFFFFSFSSSIAKTVFLANNNSNFLLLFMIGPCHQSKADTGVHQPFHYIYCSFSEQVFWRMRRGECIYDSFIGNARQKVFISSWSCVKFRKCTNRGITKESASVSNCF